MRRIVIMASSRAGVSCATRIKTAFPGDEINVLVPAATEEISRKDVLSPTARRQGTVRPDDAALAAHGIGLLETKAVSLDLEGEEVIVSTDRGSLTIRYTDLVVEVQTASRLPRIIQVADNAFSVPHQCFGQSPKALEASLDRSAKAQLPVLVAGNGMAALDAIFLAREKGCSVLWVESPKTTVPGLDRHFTEYLLRSLEDQVRRIQVDSPVAEVLSFTMDNTTITAVTLPLAGNGRPGLEDAEKGETVAVGTCLWAETFLTIHPLLREDCFILDSAGLMTESDGKPANVHIMGSGVAVPSAPLCGGGVSISPCAGSEEMGTSVARCVAEMVCGKLSAMPGTLGTWSASMPGLSVYRAGMTEAEALSAGLDADHATATVSLPGTGDAAMPNRLSITLVGHKEKQALLGVQVIGQGMFSSVAQGLFGMALIHLGKGSSLAAMELCEHAGSTGALLAQCAARLAKKCRGPVYGITPDEFMTSLTSGADFFVLDLRPYADWQNGHLPEAHNIPILQLKKRLPSEVPHYVPIVLVCANGNEAFATAITLNGMGAKDLYVLDGGMDLWPYELEKEVF